MVAPKDVAPEGRALQWNDMATNQRRIVSDNMRDAGVNLPATVADLAQRKIEKSQGDGGSAAHRKLQGVQGRSLEQVAPHLKSQPVTLQRAANTRQDFYNKGIEARRADNPDDPHQVIPHGAGWYFDHHKAIADEASKTGHPAEWAIAASGVMSPQNSPDNERAAVGAIMDANANHKVTITPEVHDHLAKNGIDVSQHLGKTVHFDSLPVGTVAHLSSGSIRDKVPTTANLHQVARGGTKQNIVKAEQVLAGDVHPDDAADPHTAPKVWSYIHNTRQAVPGTPTHVEYMGRVHHDAMVRTGQIDEHQGALDLYGLGEQKGGHMLSPESHTVEDTWQNAASFNQPKVMVGTGRTSVFKAAGSTERTYPVAGVKTRVNEDTGKRESAYTDGRVGNAAITHAFNNRATQKAAEQQSKSGVTVPPIAMQEVGWTQMRKEAGKDPEYNNRDTPAPDPLGGHVHGQMALWGEHLPARRGTSAPVQHADTDDYMTPNEQEADMRKWAAIGDNVHRARARRSTAVSRSGEFAEGNRQ